MRDNTPAPKDIKITYCKTYNKNYKQSPDYKIFFCDPVKKFSFTEIFIIRSFFYILFTFFNKLKKGLTNI